MKYLQPELSYRDQQPMLEYFGAKRNSSAASVNNVYAKCTSTTSTCYFHSFKITTNSSLLPYIPSHIHLCSWLAQKRWRNWDRKCNWFCYHSSKIMNHGFFYWNIIELGVEENSEHNYVGTRERERGRKLLRSIPQHFWISYELVERPALGRGWSHSHLAKWQQK